MKQQSGYGKNGFLKSFTAPNMQVCFHVIPGEYIFKAQNQQMGQHSL